MAKAKKVKKNKFKIVYRLEYFKVLETEDSVVEIQRMSNQEVEADFNILSEMEEDGLVLGSSSAEVLAIEK